MKKTLLLLVAALLTSLVTSAQVTDTIVSLTPSNRNVVLEEFTGIYCQYCPDGHKRANELKDAYPDRVNIINVHEGYYADNNYTTAFGTALAGQTGLTGYPAGTVNRHVFSGGVTDLSRNQWASAANTIMGMASPVNIAAEGTLDWTTRTLNIRVQLYYTGTQSVSTNALNVAIIQDYVMGSQTGGATWNPDQMVGNQYCHMHMLRHLITGQWGETIDNITPGTLVEKNYEYVIPAQLGTPNPIDAVLSNLSFIAFVCEGHQEVLTGIEVPIEHLNVTTPLDGRLIKVVEVPNTSCDNYTNAYFKFKNMGAQTVTSVTYTYTLNETTYTNTWNGSIPSMHEDIINLPELTIANGVDNTLTIQITKINDESITILPKSLTFKKNAYEGGGRMTFTLRTDQYGDETSFKFFDPNGEVVLSDGGEGNELSGSHTYEYPFRPTTTGCYRLEVYDEYGDGINTNYGLGFFKLNAEDGTQIFRDNGKFGSQATYMINVTYPAGVETLESVTVIYPNPATDMININSTSNVQRVEIFNMQGQMVKAESGDVNSISLKSLANGVYTLKLTTDNGTSMHKIVKK